MTIIPIKGAIVSNAQKKAYDRYGFEATAPCDIVLPETGEDIEVHINSGGGSVFAGSEIFTLLKAYSGKVTVKVLGIAASAASFIAMAGDVIEMSPTAQMMIHNVSKSAYGDSQVMAAEASNLEGMNQSIANAYKTKTGKPVEEWLDLMNKETWFTAEAAVEAGLADKIMFHEDVSNQYVASLIPVLPDRLINDLMALDSERDTTLSAILDRLDKLEAKANQPIAQATVEIDATKLKTTIHDVFENFKTELEADGFVGKAKATSPFGKFV